MRHFTNTPVLPRDNSNMTKRPAELAKLKKQTNKQNSKHNAEQFPNDFITSSHVLYCKFCLHNGNWKQVDGSD